MKKSLVGTLFLAMLVVSGVGSYFYSKGVISEAGEEVFETVELEDFQFEELSLVPPSMKYVVIYSMYNPTNITLTVTMDLNFFINGNPFTSLLESEELEPSDSMLFEIEFPLDADLIELFEQDTELDSFIVNGDVYVTGTGFLFPATYTLSFENENAMNVLPYLNETSSYSGF
jgi:hypothetical protein